VAVTLLFEKVLNQYGMINRFFQVFIKHLPKEHALKARNAAREHKNICSAQH
jgi:hypothetical protein